ncbi:hypothetical protein [Serratia aquatilis]|uniref:Uncharacterized protein n=1 Tax=Serratia aquatilis TaxID=1737515 RepID=A0ABV6E9N8_9GAMM
MKKYQLALQDAFSDAARKAFSSSIVKAYVQSVNGSKEFGSFAREAQPYLRWFWCEALLEKAARQSGLSYKAASNYAKNCNHLTVTSKNWSLTAHHSSNGPLPRHAVYRAMYVKGRMGDLFDDYDQGSEVLIMGGHVYLMHDGIGANVDAINLTVPSTDMKSVLFTESLDIVSPFDVEEEKVEDELDTKIVLKVEELLRKQK